MADANDTNGTRRSPTECDIVMKGGITSGVVYPQLIATLAERYGFRCIGGTSAGAIAAGAAAAAEFRRVSTSNAESFERLAKLPNELSEVIPGTRNSRLFNFFQPTLGATRLFRVLVAALNARSRSMLVRRIAIALIIGFPVGAFLGALPGVILFVMSTGWLVGLMSLAVLVLGGVVGGALAAARTLGRVLPANFFGPPFRGSIRNGLEAA
jgi:hypothetical protein